MSLVAIAAFLTLPLVQAQDVATSDTNTVQLIQQLQRRIEELEQKVNTLQSNQTAPPEEEPKQKQRMEELDQQVKILQRNRELDQEAAQAKAKEAPKISIGSQGFSLGSADDSFNVQLHGLLQADSRTWVQ